MSAITQAFTDILPFLNNICLNDALVGVPAATSNLTGTATRLQQGNRFFTVASTSVAVLPSLITGEINLPVFVMNEGANALTVYAYADTIGHNEKLNGTASTFGGATGGVSIAAGAVGVFWPEDVPKGRGGVSTASVANWSSAVFT